MMTQARNNRLLINVGESGVELRGTLVGVAPFRNPLIQAIASDSLRTLPTSIEGRTLTIADDLGISFLCDATSNAVFWIDIALERPQWRPRQTNDANTLFSGVFQLRGKALPFPLTASLADSLQEVEFPYVNISYVAHGKTIAAISLAFPLQEPHAESLNQSRI